MTDLEVTHAVRHFGPDGWSVLEHSPIEEVLANDEDWDAGLHRLGWEQFSRTGRATVDGTGSGSPFHVVVFHRPYCLEDPQFLLELSGNTSEHDEQVFVEDLPSLMTLLASWAPVLQATALNHLAAAMPTEPVQLIRRGRDSA
jgi:hypothetical protein